MEVLDHDSCSHGSSSPSLQAMVSAPLLGRTVCASCSEDILDKYLLKVTFVIASCCNVSHFLGVVIFVHSLYLFVLILVDLLYNNFSISISLLRNNVRIFLLFHYCMFFFIG